MHSFPVRWCACCGHVRHVLATVPGQMPGGARPQSRSVLGIGMWALLDHNHPLTALAPGLQTVTARWFSW